MTNPNRHCIHNWFALLSAYYMNHSPTDSHHHNTRGNAIVTKGCATSAMGTPPKTPSNKTVSKKTASKPDTRPKNTRKSNSKSKSRPKKKHTLPTERTNHTTPFWIDWLQRFFILFSVFWLKQNIHLAYHPVCILISGLILMLLRCFAKPTN